MRKFYQYNIYSSKRNKPKIDKPKRNKLIIKPCVIDGVNYKSISQASKIINIPKGTIHRRLNSENFPNYIWFIQ